MDETFCALPEWQKTTTVNFWGKIAPEDHVLHLYEEEDALIRTLGGFVSSGFSAGDSVIVIATGEHLQSLNQGLRSQGVDLFSMALCDQYIPLDAEDTLAHFMIDGWPDINLFHHLIANLLLRARKKQRKVRAFGEMVAVLWNNGLKEATVELEALWSGVSAREEFGLFCAYPRMGFLDDAKGSIPKICNCHSKMVTAVHDRASEVFFRHGAVAS